MKSCFARLREADLISSEAVRRRFHPSLLGFHRATHDFIDFSFDLCYNKAKRQKILQKRIRFLQYFFIQVADLAYHWMYNSPVARYTFVYHQGRQTALVYHHASACIFLRLDDILVWKRDMLVFKRMICNSSGIDDIQGLRLDFDVRMWYNKRTENLEFVS